MIDDFTEYLTHPQPAPLQRRTGRPLLLGREGVQGVEFSDPAKEKGNL
jgi:hypothetical protein